MTSGEWLNFNFHNIATMRVEATAPTADLMRDIFFPFLSESGPKVADIEVTGVMTPVIDPSFGETEYDYTETSLLLHDTDVQIGHENGRFRVSGSRELLVSTLPLVDRVLVTKGAAMVHAATIEYRGWGINLPAWGGTGKTSTIAKLLRRDGYAFMGDDWAFLTREGQLLAFAKPMFIKPHHKPIYPHLFAGARKPLIPVRFSRPLGKLSTRVHPLVTRYPRFARATRKFSPEHMMVRPETAFPHARFSNGGPLALNMFVERYGGDTVRLAEKSTDWMISRLVGNFHAETSKHSQEVVTAMGACGIVPIEDYFSDKAEVLRSGVGETPNYLLQVPQRFSPDKASDAIVEQLEKVISKLGIGTQPALSLVPNSTVAVQLDAASTGN
jgi:hypothetical protein